MVLCEESFLRSVSRKVSQNDMFCRKFRLKILLPWLHYYLIGMRCDLVYVPNKAPSLLFYLLTISGNIKEVKQKLYH